MLPKPKRLNLKKDFRFVSSGKKMETPHLLLRFRSGENTQALVGIAVSSKNFKKAHERNAARRLVSAAVEELYSLLPNNLNLVIMPKAKALDCTKEQILGELKDVKNLSGFN